MQYIFILGQAQDLAKQEIINLINIKPELSGDNFLVTESNQTADELMPILGGTIKIAKYLNEIDNLDDLTADKWLKILPKTDDKLKFGFSLYNDSAKNQQKLTQLALAIKKELKQAGRKARLVTSKEAILSSVIVAKNKLLNSELIIIKQDDKYILGLTQVVQDFVNYGYRDVKRPQRDDQSGMLPPKLAQMMINLSGPDRNKTILDPFCGSGTILQEAALLNFKKIYGCDQSEQAIKDSRANLDWLRKNFNLQININIQKINVRNLSQKLTPNSIDLIVTEPFMGPARIIHKQSDDYFVKLKNELQTLYLESFRQFKKILKKNGEIIFIFPIFNLRTEKIHTLNKNTILDLGFESIKPNIKSNNLSNNGNIVYSRPNQKVQREISHWKINN